MPDRRDIHRSNERSRRWRKSPLPTPAKQPRGTRQAGQGRVSRPGLVGDYPPAPWRAQGIPGPHGETHVWSGLIDDRRISVAALGLMVSLLVHYEEDPDFEVSPEAVAKVIKARDLSPRELRRIFLRVRHAEARLAPFSTGADPRA